MKQYRAISVEIHHVCLQSVLNDWFNQGYRVHTVFNEPRLHGVRVVFERRSWLSRVFG